MPTNPFTSSLSSNRRQQILVPKELFPRKNSSGLNSGIDPTSSSSSSSSYRRPVKLPLRKHHSFHFQSSQTVAGSVHALKHEQFQPSKQSSTTTTTTSSQQQSTKERYRNQGPLVFKPFSENREKSAFKPIVPSSLKSRSAHNAAVDAAAIESSLNGYDASSMPRICGTSLKRHISNVETFSTAINQWNQSDDNDEDNMILQQLQPTQTTMDDVNRRRKIHYADLAPLPTPSTTVATAASSNVNAIYHNDRNNNSSSNENSDNIDSSSSGGGGGGIISERHSTTNNAKTMDHKTMNTSSATIAPSAGHATTTQYATLRFDEVSI